MLPHMENLYAMETSELKDLLEMLSQSYAQEMMQVAQAQQFAQGQGPRQPGGAQKYNNQ